MSRITDGQRAAIEQSVAGGPVGYVQRMRADHGPTFTEAQHVPGLVYSGCKCGRVGCSAPIWLIHIQDLIDAYEAKVEDFAAETLRANDG